MKKKIIIIIVIAAVAFSAIVTINWKWHQYLENLKPYDAINEPGYGGPEISSISSPGAGKLKVQWNSQTTETTGYQLQYSITSDFSSGNHVRSITDNTTLTTTFSGLTTGTMYYVRIRTYKLVDDVRYYSGWSAAQTFTVIPPGTTISSLTSPAAGKLKVQWNSQTTETTGYQLQYSITSDFSSDQHKKFVPGNTTLSKTFTDLVTGTTYYVRVRTYKKINDVLYYSGWSPAQSITVS